MASSAGHLTTCGCQHGRDDDRQHGRDDRGTALIDPDRREILPGHGRLSGSPGRGAAAGYLAVAHAAALSRCGRQPLRRSSSWYGHPRED
jgi:hypothetical protein